MLCRIRSLVRPSVFQAEEKGSIPLCGTNLSMSFSGRKSVSLTDNGSSILLIDTISLREEVMDEQEAIRICMSAHYYLMSNKRFWYEDHLKEASKLLCVAASNLRSHSSAG